jgi:hypothetical protein
MSKVKESFDSIFDLILSEIEKQRDIHNSAFGKPNASKVVLQVEKNSKQLKSWLESLQLVHNEMENSGLWGECPIQEETLVEDNISDDISLERQKPGAVIIFGVRYQTKTWKDVCIKVIEILYQKNQQLVMSFETNSKLNTKRRQNFSTTKNKIKQRPIKIPNTPIWMETNNSANDLKKRWTLALEICGFSANDVIVELREK